MSDLSLAIPRNSIVALAGESGSGKSLTAFSLVRLLPPGAEMTGRITLFGQEQTIALHEADEHTLRNIRGGMISLIFQEPMTALNPTLRCGPQVEEVLIRHKQLRAAEARAETCRLFAETELPDPDRIYRSYPHEISGGQKQRVMIAMAIACQPLLLIADEPTTALDASVRRGIMELIRKLQRQRGLSVLLISHDLDLLGEYADYLMVMHQGRVMEEGAAASVLSQPASAYTAGLLACKPTPEKKGTPLPTLSESPVAVGVDSELSDPFTRPGMPPGDAGEPLLSVRNLTVEYTRRASGLGRPAIRFRALNEVSLDIARGEILGLAGESGCGKTTLGRCLLGLIPPTSGAIELQGSARLFQKKEERTRLIQMVFQDPYGSLNPQLRIGEAIEEPLLKKWPPGERKERTIQLLEDVGLTADQYRRYPHQFSGGQRQRICIARALACEPRLMVFDESVSALDLSIQAQILNLIQELKHKHGFSALFISHDLSVVHYLSDRIAIMREGRLVECGPANRIIREPADPYTQALVEAGLPQIRKY